MLLATRSFAKFLGIFLIIVWSTNIIAQESNILITRVACVDIPKIFKEVNRNQSYQNFLLGMEESFRLKATEIESRIQELEDYLVTETELTASETNEIHNEIEFQRENLKNQFSGMVNRDELILRGVYRLIKNLAEKEGYALVVEKSSTVVYNKAEVDITDAILKAMGASSNDENGADTESE